MTTLHWFAPRGNVRVATFHSAELCAPFRQQSAPEILSAGRVLIRLRRRVDRSADRNGRPVLIERRWREAIRLPAAYGRPQIGGAA